MESSVKAAMLKSSHVLTSPPTAPESARGLRRVQSGSSLNLESPRTPRTGTANTPAETLGGVQSAQHSRGVSVDLVPRRPKSRSGGLATPDLGTGKSGTQKAAALSPVQIVSVLTAKSSLELDVDVVKKLRLFLRNEAARCILPVFLCIRAEC
jgi:hypothetical protein